MSLVKQLDSAHQTPCCELPVDVMSDVAADQQQRTEEEKQGSPSSTNSDEERKCSPVS